MEKLKSTVSKVLRRIDDEGLEQVVGGGGGWGCVIPPVCKEKVLPKVKELPEGCWGGWGGWGGWGWGH